MSLIITIEDEIYLSHDLQSTIYNAIKIVIHINNIKQFYMENREMMPIVDMTSSIVNIIYVIMLVKRLALFSQA